MYQLISSWNIWKTSQRKFLNNTQTILCLFVAQYGLWTSFTFLSVNIVYRCIPNRENFVYDWLSLVQWDIVCVVTVFALIFCIQLSFILYYFFSARLGIYSQLLSHGMKKETTEKNDIQSDGSDRSVSVNLRIARKKMELQTTCGSDSYVCSAHTVSTQYKFSHKNSFQTDCRWLTQICESILIFNDAAIYYTDPIVWEDRRDDGWK